MGAAEGWTRRKATILVGATVLAITLVAGCAGASTDEPSTPSTGSPAATTSPDGSTARPSPSPSGDVRLEVAIVGQGARVAVANRSDGPVAGQDQRSQCSVLVLEVEVDGAWTATPPCPSGPPPTDVVIAPGQAFTVDLVLEPGTYRVRFPYSPGERFDPAKATEAVSDPFLIG